MKFEAVLGEGGIGAGDHDGEDRDLHFLCKDECAGFELFDFAVGGSGPFGEHEDRTPFGQCGFGIGHHLFDAFSVTAAQPDVAVEVHVPADQGDFEDFDFGYEFEMEKQVEQNKDVEEGLVVGCDDVCSVSHDVFPAFYFDTPAGDDPGVKRSPETGELLKQYKPFIERSGNDPYHECDEEKKYGCGGDEGEPGDGNQVVNHGYST